MTTLRLEFEPDPEDGGARLEIDLDTAKGDRFFVAWLNPFDEIEYINTDEIDESDTFAKLHAVLDEDAR